MDYYAVIGNPIEHSKSPLIHSLFAKQCKQALEYTALLSEHETFESDVKNFFVTGKGMNVTVPFKIKAMQLADVLSEAAQQAGAVNTLIKQGAQIIGDNTDGLGLVNDLCINHQQDLTDKTIVIIGAGGASKGVIMPLLEKHPAHIIIANRTLEKAQALVERFKPYGKLSAVALHEVKTLKPIDLLINASSAGLSGESVVLPENLSRCFCYDMIYSKTLTPFLRDAHTKGCTQYADGLGMLVEQAAQSFFLWRGIKPDTQAVLKTLKNEL